ARILRPGRARQGPARDQGAVRSAREGMARTHLRCDGLHAGTHCGRRRRVGVRDDRRSLHVGVLRRAPRFPARARAPSRVTSQPGRDARPPRGTVMKLLWFHLMPYTDLPEDFTKKHASVWVDIDSRLFDASKAHGMYNDFM